MAAPSRALSVAAALWLGTLATPSLAQGTAEQREACAPDAIRLCQDAIPDVAKTTACMKAHLSELSPSCHRLFVAATGPEESRSRRRTARTDSDEATPLDFGVLDIPDDASDTPASRAADRRNARRVVRNLCRNSVLDADTCRLTNAAIDLAR